MPGFTTLVAIQEAAAHLDDPDWAFVDCRFVLTDPAAGRRAYLDGHIPGAVHADLDADLSSSPIPGVTGRHPLPAPAAFDDVLSRLGIDDGVQVVAYDERTGAMAAARLWWLLRWAGHDLAAVLDGGWTAWTAAGLPREQEERDRPRRPVHGHYRPEMTVTAAEVLHRSAFPASTILDARGADRFRGENETIDPVAGHIPGARSLPYTQNLTGDGHMLPPETVRERIEKVAAVDGETIVYCGSGVTAAHLALACAHAGMDLPRLYPGSWSEWIADPERPVALGEE